MNAEPLELAGLLAACGAAAAALVLADPRAPTVAMVLALAAAPALVLGDVWDQPRVQDFRDSPAQVSVALLVAVAGVGALILLFRRYASAFPIAVFALLPIRVPVEIGGETANLLIPVYLVIAAEVLRQVWSWVGRSGGVRKAEPSGRLQATLLRPRGWSDALRVLLAATLVLYAVQAAYSEDVSNAIENVGFFLTPFAVMAALLVEVRWTQRLLGQVLAAVAAVAALTALVGLGQSAVRDLFLNPELFDANQLHQYFRVNSIFFDPNIFGRYLALAVTALAAYVAWEAGSVRALALAGAVAALALAGMAFSYSVTSFAAVLAGLGMVAILRWGWRGMLGAGAIGVAGLVALLIAGGTPGSDIQTDRGIDSGREDLIEGGLELAEDRPLAGWGSGSFGAVFYERIERARTTVSHSEPITVAAEQGAAGLVVYLALVVAALVTLLGAGARAMPGRATIGACFVAMLVHSLGYAGFATDPATWALLGLGIALRREPG